MFITGDEALTAARREIKSAIVQDDPMFAPWSDSSLGQPVLVRTVFKQPSYWLVPVLVQERVVGFVRVLETGKVAAVGVHCRDPSRIATCPATITGIDAEEADRRARTRVHPELGETPMDPVFVHDGPPGREAWLIEVLKDDRPTRWVFVTPAFSYERRAGEMLREDRE